MDKNIFKDELDICRQNYALQGGCRRGKCDECGVVLLLHKLYTGETIEDTSKIKNIKKQYLGDI